MANEYLQRTPTSTGNRRIFTWAGWIKLSDQNVTHLFTATPAKDNNTQLFINSAGQIFFFNREGSDVTTDQVVWDPYFRDMGSWKHIIINADTTQASAADRVRCYVNGVLLDRDETQSKVDNVVDVDTLPKDQEFWRLNGSGYEHYIGASLDNSLNAPNANQFTDVFYVDGQQLGPGVFGFYKEGDGYVSAGSTMSTDFRPGQWVPKRPRIIKTEIERRGGFGVNGFYLPMNDSSNPGADFHCTPNSIITLKGEDLPQPRNGAPTTTDAYVSQMRSDPYAANLVLAVPGISTATGSNLITNGTFDSDVSSWTATDCTTAWENGQLKITRSGGGGLTANQAFTTETGKRYTISGTVNSSTSRGDLRVYDGTGTGGSLIINFTGTNGQTLDFTGSFTASSTASTVVIAIDNNGGIVYIDNIVVKQEDVPRDYSADIKGSGSNKTVTALGSAGVGYEIPSYYGSAMTFDGTGDYCTLADSSDFTFGTGDFTIECWRKHNESTTVDAYVAQYDRNGAVSSNRAFWLGSSGSDRESFYWYNGEDTYQVLSPTNYYSIDQWDHICAERHNGVITLYVNGVAAAVDTSSNAALSLNDVAGDISIGGSPDSGGTPNYYELNGYIQDVRIYKGVAKYKGGFDVPKPYTPVGIESWRTVADVTANNFATLNPLYPRVYTSGTDRTFSNGNLTGSTITDGVPNLVSNMGVSYGQKVYFEVRNDSRTGGSGDVAFIGIKGIGENDNPGNYSTSTFYYGNTGTKYKYVNGSVTIGAGAYGDAYTDGDIIGVSIDSDGTVVMYKNGVSQGTLDTFTEAQYPLFLVLQDGSSGALHTYTVNFGQNPSFSGQVTAGTNADDSGKGLFKYAPPSGFLALCEDNLPAPAIADPGEHFKTVLYTGDGNGGHSITGVGFQPDLVWIKVRNHTGYYHELHDSVRGAGIGLFSNISDAESTINTLESFDTNGFTVSLQTALNGTNQSGKDYVAWCWKAGGAAVSNTDGSITSQVSANQTAGFSIVSYTGNGTVGATVGHGLGKKPKFFITKNRDTAGNGWPVFSEELLGSTGYLYLHNTNAASTAPNVGAPTSSVLTLSGYSDNNASGDEFIAYCWAEIEGFSKFGSYTGNQNVDGPFVYCGFKPALVMVKNISVSGGYWNIWDSSRISTNPCNKVLFPNVVDDEQNTVSGVSNYDCDFVSNGFKIRTNTATHVNGSGNTIIFAAFAESPFKTSNAK